MRLSLLTLLFTFLCTCVLAQVPGYYNDVNLNLTGSALLSELSDKVTSTETATPSYTPGVWDALKQTDLVPGGDGTRVILVYGYSDTDGVTNTDRTRGREQNGGGTTDWNREHVFPKSLGNPNLGTSGPGADVHHLRASDVSRNGSRGSRKFADDSGNSKITPQGHWYPGDEFKGDVARMVLYMYLRYGSRCLPSNVAVGTTNSSDANMINLLLEWNVEDPVSALEDQRNPIVEGIQGNRNPFIDNPAFATTIWGGPQAEDRFGGGGGNPGGGNSLCGTTVSSFPYAESFESNLGSWTNPGSGDDFDWTRNSGGTPSGSTGPGSAAAGSQYLFMESSSPNYSTKRAVLYGPCFDLPSGNADFTFKYHMYGASSMGSLALEASLNGTSWTTLWSKAGNQGNSWQTATVDLNGYAGQNVQLRFNGVTGTTWQGDMAIDELRLTTGGSSGPVTTNTNLTITFDNYPEETSWALKNSAGTTVNSGGTYGNQAGGSTINIATALPAGCYTLTFNDTYGDGMCCSYGNGSFTLRNTAGNGVITSGGSFGSSVTRSFCVGGASLTAPDLPTTNFAPATKELSFYPNPADDQLNIVAPEGTTYRILSQAGQLLRTGKTQATVDLTTLPSGTYFLTLSNSENTVTRVFVRR